QRGVVLTMQPNADRTGVVFGVQSGVPVTGGNAAKKREHDAQLGGGTMTKSGVTCPCCRVPCMSMDDLRVEGQAGRFGAVLTAVVVDGDDGKEYRLPHPSEVIPPTGLEAVGRKVFWEGPFR